MVNSTPEDNFDQQNAKLIVRKFFHVHRFDYNKTFELTVDKDILCIIMAKVTAKNLKWHQIGVNNAFTESRLDDVYILRQMS